MKKIWILVADGGGARVVSITGNPATAEPKLEFELLHEHKKSGAIMADRPGRSFASTGTRRSAMVPSSDPVDVEEGKFIGKIIDRLAEGASSKAFDRLIVVAPPKMLGGLRKAYTKPLQEKLTGEVAKDLTQHMDKDVLALLSEQNLL